MNTLNPEEIDAILTEVRASLQVGSTVQWTYWYRYASYEAFERWGIDKTAIQDVICSATSDDVVKSELQHHNCKSLVFVLVPWLGGTVGIDEFAYVKFALTFDVRNRLETVTVLSFKAASASEQVPTFDHAFQNYFEWNRSTWLAIDPTYIRQIAPENLSETLLFIALSQQPELVDAIPPTKLTQQLVNRLCRDQVTTIFFLPTSFWEEWRLLPALHQQPDQLANVPKNKLTAKIINEICMHYPWTLRYVPQSEWHPGLVKKAISAEPSLIKQFPPAQLTPTYVDLAWQHDPTVIYALPHSFWSERYLFEAVEQNPHGLIKARESDFSRAIIELAITTDPSVIHLLPPHLIMEIDVLEAVTTYPQAASAFAGTWTVDFIEEVFAKQPESFPYLPIHMLSGERCLAIALDYPQFFAYVPKQHLTQRLVDAAINYDPTFIAHVPKQFKHPQLCLRVIEHDEGLWEHIPKHLKRKIQQIIQTSPIEERLC